MRHIIEIAVPAFLTLFTIGAIVHTVIKDRRHKALMEARQRDRTNFNGLFRETYLDNIGTIIPRNNPLGVTNLNDIYGQTYLDEGGNFFTGLRQPDTDAMVRMYQDALVFGTGIGELRMRPRRRTPKKRNLPDWF